MAPNDPVIRGYARALFAIAEAEGALPEVEDELFRFARIIESETALREGLTDIAVPAENKKAMLADLLGDKVSSHTVHLLGFIVEQGRARELGQIVDAMIEMAAEERRHAVAEVRSAVALSDEQKTKLQAALSKATGREVELRTIVDPELVGGVVARVGDEVFDGSVKTRLRDARDQLGSV